jgi:hypothetical protein
MGVPFEALLPYGVCLAVRDRLLLSSSTTPTDSANLQFFGITGAGLSKIRNIQNGGKRARHSIDQWDRQSAKTPFSD